MKKSNTFQPDWREDVPQEGSYRELFKFDPHSFKHPSSAWYEMFKETFNLKDEDFKERQPGGDEQVRLDRKIGLNREQIQAFVDILGEAGVRSDDYSRVKYSHGKALDENMDFRNNSVPRAADIVLHPRDKKDVQKIVAYCNAQKIPVSTYGGGSGVVLGIQAERGGVSVVLNTHMNQVLKVNDINQTALVQAGIMGPDYEEALNNAPERFNALRRYTCGHFPQSFHISSVGGWILALGSGQASTYYGDAGDLVISQEYVTPAGIIKTHDIPGTATGPKANDMLKGSEGAYGILVEATMKIYRHMPENSRRFAFMFPSWDAAVDASREIMQGEFGMPAVFRISDPEETEIGLKLKGFGDGLLEKFLRGRGFKPMERSLCIGTAEGEKGYACHVENQAKKIARRYGAMSLTGYATREWEKGRYSDIHMRDDLLDYGIILDTLESGVTWENLHRLHQGVRAFVKERPGTLCMTHASHFYPQGTNLYFIFIMKPRDEAEFYRFRDNVESKILEHGGSISHHHGVGRMFSPWMKGHLGSEQMGLLRAVKNYLDPNNIMNPGAILGLNAADLAGSKD